MAGLTRHQIEEIKRRLGVDDMNHCETCRGLYIVGVPGLFASAFRRNPTPGSETKLTHEEAQEFIDGCPRCGEHVETHAIVMRGLRHHRGEEQPPPDPWPINEWPTPIQPNAKSRGNIYDADE